MNIANLRAVQDQIRQHPERLDMSQFSPNNDPQELVHSCGTSGCIAGWAAAMAGHKTPHALEDADYSWIKALENQRSLVQAAAEFLGLVTPDAPLTFQHEIAVPTNNDVVLQLFFAEDFMPGGDLEFYTADDAINAIETLIETGRAVWPTFDQLMEREDAAQD